MSWRGRFWLTPDLQGRRSAPELSAVPAVRPPGETHGLRRSFRIDDKFLHKLRQLGRMHVPVQTAALDFGTRQTEFDDIQVLNFKPPHCAGAGCERFPTAWSVSWLRTQSKTCGEPQKMSIVAVNGPAFLDRTLTAISPILGIADFMLFQPEGLHRMGEFHHMVETEFHSRAAFGFRR